MGHCINCLFQGDNSLDETGHGRVFCMVRRKWMSEEDTCEHFTEYADLSKDIRAEYAFEIREQKYGSGSANKLSDAIKQNWKAMIIAMLLAFVMFMIVVKFFDKYIF